MEGDTFSKFDDDFLGIEIREPDEDLKEPFDDPQLPPSKFPRVSLSMETNVVDDRIELLCNKLLPILC